MSIRERVSGERGVATIVVLAFMVLAIPTMAAALSFSATVSNSAKHLRDATSGRLSAVGGNDYAIYRLIHEPGFKESLVPGVPVNATLPLNGTDVTVTWEKVGVPGGTVPPVPPAVLQTAKLVSPASIPADTPTNVTYTIDVTNTGPATVTVDRIKDGLPPYFDYVTGTTTGVTTSDPSIFGFADGQGSPLFRVLTWDIGQTLGPAGSIMLQFQALVDAPDGHYCNEAWADPGGKETGTGPAAKLQSGVPTEPLCDNEAVDVRKTVDLPSASAGVETTFRYRIEAENLSATQRDMYWILDILPPGFVFDSGSVSGDITTSNPFAWFSGGQQHLSWFFFFGKSLDPAQTKHLEFDATATLSTGTYANQTWVSVENLASSAYTYPTADVTVWDVFDLTVTDGNTTSIAQVWVGPDGFEVTEWEIV